jgi:hypothetical protein
LGSETKTTNETPTVRRVGAFVFGALSASKPAIGALALLLGSGLTALAAESGTDNRAPEVPEEIAVGPTNKVHFHGFAVGVQIYTWNGNDWGNAVPRATLFDDDGNVVVSHFGTTNGPAWRSNSGSRWWENCRRKEPMWTPTTPSRGCCSRQMRT